MNVRFIARLGLFSAAALLAGAAAAAADPPGRIGRLSYIEGTVSLHVPGQDQWSAAAINYPVTSGYGLWTEPDGRAELQIGGAGMRLDHSTEAEVLRLDDASTVLRIDQGVVNVHVNSLPPGGITVMTPVGQVSLETPGSYDIDAGQPNGDAPSDQARVTVLEGQARIAGPRAALEIGHSEAAIVTGNPPAFQLVEGDSTDFDNWSLARERREAPRTALTYVAPEMTGYQDLDANGQWNTDPDYGAVWYPTAVPVGWAPYHDGHWVWIAPWGWTWVDDAPWGFAPFHYGRWAYIHDRWGWAPGEREARPYYAPALVAFIGIGISVGPSVGWVPLAPGERFHPYYHASDRYAQNVNRERFAHVRPATYDTANANADRFRNARAATVVPQAAFTRAAPVQRAAVSVPQAQLASARATANPGNVAPTREARGAVAHPEAVQANAAANERPERPAAAPPVEPNARSGPGARSAAVPSAPTRPDAPRTDTQGRAETPAHPEAAPSGAQPPARIDTQGRAETPTHPQAAVPQPPPRIETQGRVEAPPGAQPPARPEAQPHPQAAVPQPPARPEAQRPAPAPQPEARAPGPPISRQAVVVPPRPPARLPPAPVEHPAQQTHLAPTPQGWQRVAPAPPPRQPVAQPAHAAPPPAPPPAPPAQHAAPAPAPAHAAPPANSPPPDHKDDRHP